MPWKQWAYLERVTSADFQSFIQNQTVPQFTNVAQRDAVYTVIPPPTGALCITVDVGTVWRYTGSAWVVVGSAYATARQANIGAGYAGGWPIRYHTARLSVTTDANGYVTITAASINMPITPQSLFHATCDVTDLPYRANLYQANCTATSYSFRVLNNSGAPLASTAVNVNVNIWYQ